MIRRVPPVKRTPGITPERRIGPEDQTPQQKPITRRKKGEQPHKKSPHRGFFDKDA